MDFRDLPLAGPVLRAVADKGYTTATPIQAAAIPPVLDGRDVLGCAQTGTGKTAAFALPIINHFAELKSNPKHRNPTCLVLCPTRELAVQIAESFQGYSKHTRLRGALIFGGVNQNPQVKKLRAGVDVLVATPGRLLDLMNQGHARLESIDTLVLDEADRMLDMGFMPDIRRITAEIPRKRQTLLFSATMPGPIRELADDLLRNPVHIEITPPATTVERIEQNVYFIEKPHKTRLLAHLLSTMSIERAIVFTRTKYGADKVARQLRKANVESDAIHGDKSQNARQRALDYFKKGRINVLVATDIASRGIDVDGISHVFNYDLTHEPESYVHRIGRTARAGATGHAISFCDPSERKNLRAIERATRQTIEPIEDAGFAPPASEASGARAQADKPTGEAQAEKPGKPGAKSAHKSKPRKQRSAAQRKAAAARKSERPQAGKKASSRRQRSGAPGKGAMKRKPRVKAAASGSAAG
ncbi:DEAD/DEAH box helicase [Mucisphaera calidilacus]|uniref:DEAD-box ATP-dependent RNA helicase RhpA n=1 Tax=Mucisphaera calidilacus TaxID=2527982 RepID=A0A518BUS1_9BACT|nr:DEAD/DEAH box helicase [Mucisphaera calidilacus]QDU70730.1 ATP-dependent RNA helicase RhlE [Mucisphaera calidilacus]